MEKLSVIIPCYNVEKFIREGLDSILNQTYKNLEIICVNDCSTDNTLNILEEYSRADKRIKVYSNEKNEGLIFTLNRLIDLSSCEILVRMDPDDISELNRISVLYRKLREKKLDLVSSNYTWINEHSKKLRKRGLQLCVSNLGCKYTAIFNSPFPHPQSMFKKSIVYQRKYDFDYKAAEDYKLWTELLLQDGFTAEIVDNELYRYRINESGMSKIHASLQADNHIKIAKNYVGKLLGVSTESFSFWNIAKKTYAFKGYSDLKYQIETVDNLRKIFISTFSPNLTELKEINSYTFQYLVYLFKNLWELADEKEIPKGTVIKLMLASSFSIFKLINFKDTKWIVENL